MKYLSLEEILQLHYFVIRDFGGAHGVRDEKRLASIALVPKQNIFLVEQYEGVVNKAAAYMSSIVCGHPFIDGNKRTSVVVLGVFLSRNGYKITASQKELEDFAVCVASSSMGVEEVACWLKEHTTNRVDI